MLDPDKTTDASLRTAMSSFGEVTECVVTTDTATGRSKGVGFVVFKHIDCALAAIEAKTKEVDVRTKRIPCPHACPHARSRYAAGRCSLLFAVSAPSRVLMRPALFTPQGRSATIVPSPRPDAATGAAPEAAATSTAAAAPAPAPSPAPRASNYGSGGSGGGGLNSATRDQRRFIIRGLPWDTSSETLLSVFERYGEIEEGAVVVDKVRGMPASLCF